MRHGLRVKREPIALDSLGQSQVLMMRGVLVLRLGNSVRRKRRLPELSLRIIIFPNLNTSPSQIKDRLPSSNLSPLATIKVEAEVEAEPGARVVVAVVVTVVVAVVVVGVGVSLRRGKILRSISALGVNTPGLIAQVRTMQISA